MNPDLQNTALLVGVSTFTGFMVGIITGIENYIYTEDKKQYITNISIYTTVGICSGFISSSWVLLSRHCIK